MNIVNPFNLILYDVSIQKGLDSLLIRSEQEVEMQIMKWKLEKCEMCTCSDL